MSQEVEELRKIRELLELLAEDKIAERDAKPRTALRQIVGASPKIQSSVLLMDGVQTQPQIRAKTGVHQGNFSTVVGKLHKANLLVGDTKTPKLLITIPPNFFEIDER
jgi:hypothetical protein